MFFCVFTLFVQACFCVLSGDSELFNLWIDIFFIEIWEHIISAIFAPILSMLNGWTLSHVSLNIRLTLFFRWDGFHFQVFVHTDFILCSF